MKKKLLWTVISKDKVKDVPSVLELDLGYIKVLVHRHIGYPPDKWLCDFRPPWSKIVLGNKDLESAKIEALNKLKEYFSNYVRLLEEAITKLQLQKEK